MSGMLHTSPFTEREQVHLVQPFVHRITERTVEVAVEGMGNHHSLGTTQKIAIH